MDTLGCEGTSGGITVAKIVSRVPGSLQPGEIVLMHCGSNPANNPPWTPMRSATARQRWEQGWPVPGWPLTEPPAATGC